jgi:phenylacetyl-CoA:acceptor oxidoreductase subunit 2
MHSELGTDPQIKYLYSTPAVPGRDPGEADRDEDRLGDPANPLVGERQRFWDLRASMNLTLGGMGSGLGSIGLIACLVGPLGGADYAKLLIGSAALMASGLFFVFLEIARKFRFAYVILRPQSSWMSREAFVAGVYFPTLAAYWLWSQDWLLWIAGIATLAYLYCQAQILYGGKGIPAWRAPLIPWMLVATGLLEGTGLYALAHGVRPESFPVGARMAGLGFGLAVINAALWIRYRGSAKARGIPPLARRVLDRYTPIHHLVAHALPAMAFAAALLGPGAPAWLIAVGGAAAVAGGAAWKILVITRACYQQGFALAKLPQRGSGEYAAPARLEGYRAAVG